MNAITTAEYVVIVERKLSEIQEKISEHAAQGFRLASLETNPETSFEAGSYTAVMVREPAPTYLTEWQARMTEWEEAFKKWDGTPTLNPEKHFEQIVMLQHSVEALERAKEIHIDLITRLESRVTELERKVLYPTIGAK